MLKLVIVGTIAASVASYSINFDIVAEIKAKATTWVPAEPHENQFYGWTDEQLKTLLGTKIPVHQPIFDNAEPTTAPASTWDWRT